MHGQPQRPVRHTRVTLDVYQEVVKTEPCASTDALDRLKERGSTPKTIRAGKGYHNQKFLWGCCKRGVAPRCAQIEGLQVAGGDACNTKTAKCGSKGYPHKNHPSQGLSGGCGTWLQKQHCKLLLAAI
jgi:hypothetical protein